MSDSAAYRDAGDNENINTVAAAVQPPSLSLWADGEERASRSIMNENAVKNLVMDGASSRTENYQAEITEHEHVPRCHCSFDPFHQKICECKDRNDLEPSSNAVSGLKENTEQFVHGRTLGDKYHQGSKEMESSISAADEMDISQSQQEVSIPDSASSAEYHTTRCDQNDIERSSVELKRDQQNSDSTCENMAPFDEYFTSFERSEDIVEVEEEKELLSEGHESVHPFVGGLTLDQLNDDALFLIASYLEARVVKYALSQVCQRFKAMFDNEAYWKMRITVRWPKKFPAVEIPPDFNWVDACVEREDSYRVWSDPGTNTDHFLYSCNVFGEVDAVHLMKEGKIAVSGDRNRILNLIDLSKYPGPEGDAAQLKNMLIHTNRTAHQGWIWSIASCGDQVITGSWDTWVRKFDLDAACSQSAAYKLKSAVLSLYVEQNEIAAACFDKRVYFIDQRSSSMHSKVFHSKPVLCVTGDEKYIISGSEDKSISIYDRRAGKIFMMFKDLESYPMCLSYSDNQLWYGDRVGMLHLHDGTEGVFQHIGSYDIGHTEKMTGVINSRGALFTCSGDRTIKVLHPTRDPDPITTIAIHTKEIANIDYNNGVLVSAGGDDCIGVWLPKHWERDTYLL